jgi:hypothetical protein
VHASVRGDGRQILNRAGIAGFKYFGWETLAALGSGREIPAGILGACMVGCMLI